MGMDLWEDQLRRAALRHGVKVPVQTLIAVLADVVDPALPLPRPTNTDDVVEHRA